MADNNKTLLSIVGGGDSASAAEKSGYADKLSHISTGEAHSLIFSRFHSRRKNYAPGRTRSSLSVVSPFGSLMGTSLKIGALPSRVPLTLLGQLGLIEGGLCVFNSFQHVSGWIYFGSFIS